MSIVVDRSANGRVETWWLTREEARNAITLEMWTQLRDLASSLNSSVRVVVIRGRGAHFSAGADIVGLGRSLAADVDGSNYREINRAAETAVASMTVPTVAAIDGFCVGGGVQLALACDLRIASRSARFAVTPAKLGIAYPASALTRLVAIVGPAAASELLLSADTIDVERALNISLVTRIVDDLDAGLDALVSSLISRSPFTQMATKSVMNALIASNDVESLGRRWESASLEHGDLAEGLSAFREKREPNF